jgi:hypothetical protein
MIVPLDAIPCNLVHSHHVSEVPPVSSARDSFNLKMETADSSETLVLIYQARRSYIPEGSNLECCSLLLYSSQTSGLCLDERIQNVGCFRDRSLRETKQDRLLLTSLLL